MSIKKLTCAERDEILIDSETGKIPDSWVVVSGLTDVYGEFGIPRVETTWGRGDVQVEDIRHPKMGQYSPPDECPCEHYKLTGEDRK